MKSKKKIWMFLTIVFASIAVVAVAWLVVYRVKLNRQQDEYNNLKNSVVLNGGDGSQSQTKEVVDLTPYNVPDKRIDFKSLKEKNQDIYAWITIPDTNIDYPVLQHPTDLNYYIDYNMDGTKGYPGCICSQFINSKDFDDFNTVLYGHNMNAGTMFANLHFYKDSEFFNSHPYIYVYTEEGTLVYQVFAAYTFTDIHLLMGFDLTKEEVRQTYIDNIFELSGITDNFNRDVEVTTDSKILSLETCVNNQDDKRYIVAAVLVADARQ